MPRKPKPDTAGDGQPTKPVRIGKAECMRRVEEVLKIRIAGAEIWDVREFAAQQDPPWGVSDSQLRKYMLQADELIRKGLERNRKKRLRRRLAQRSDLYARALNVGMLGAALAILKDLDELDEAYPVKPHGSSNLPDQATPATPSAAPLSDAERLAEMARLLDAVRTRLAGQDPPGPNPANPGAVGEDAPA